MSYNQIKSKTNLTLLSFQFQKISYARRQRSPGPRTDHTGGAGGPGGPRCPRGPRTDHPGGPGVPESPPGPRSGGVLGPQADLKAIASY
jgi:hypothetical protein